MTDLFLHPSVTSFITDESQIYQSAAGLTTLYCPVFSERGEDGVLQNVDGPGDNDYINKFGVPNPIKYGQAPLNVINWVQSGGTAVVMRLLPEDAKYAHAILDFQSKEIDVIEWQKDGKTVVRQKNKTTDTFEFVMPDGTVVADEAAIIAAGGSAINVTKTLFRPKIKRVPEGATTISTIQEYIEKLHGSISEDNFKHNVLGFFYPKGRGADYYNNLEFKITLNEDLDDTYSFRIYNVELFYTDKDGITSRIDGPFQVSFEPTAMDLSQESMFITEVLKTYGKEVGFELFENGYEDIGELINSEVDPALLDPFFLTERSLVDSYPVDHNRSVLSSGITTLERNATTGDSFIYVEEPDLIYTNGQILIKGIELKLVTAIDVTTGKISLDSPLTDDFYEGAPIAALASEEFRQIIVIDDKDDSSKTVLEVLQIVDGEGVDILLPGPAKFVVDNVENDVVIESIDKEMKLVTLSAGVVMDSSAADIYLKQYFNKSTDDSADIDFDSNILFSGGYSGTFEPAFGGKLSTKDQLLIKAYNGSINEDILLKKFWPIDVILDANYNDYVKAACNELASVIRRDCIFISDLGFTANPQQAIDKRTDLGFSNFYTSVFSQDMSVADEYSGREIKVTIPYFIATKIPNTDISHGVHWPFVGPRRGVISGFKNLSWNPNDPWQERLYKKQINYVKQDPKRSMLYGQLTSQTVNSALSDISHVRALLVIQREVEDMMEDYIFEFIDKQTLDTMNYNLSQYLKKWLDNRCCESIKGSVYSSAYDKKQKIARVRIEILFTAILERIIINLVVK